LTLQLSDFSDRGPPPQYWVRFGKKGISRLFPGS
jgi:hypothetical protein